MTADPRAVAMLQRYLSACESRDPDVIADCFSEDALVRDPANEQIRGRDAIHRYFAEIYGDLSTLSFRCSPLYWCRNSTAVRWEGSATRKNGTRLSYEGIDVFSFGPDGQIDEMWAFWSPADLVA
jgi:ketosteroid isomerase-like protein